MDGGVDKVYSQTMFPGIEKEVKAAIKTHGGVSDLGRPWLPIGQAIQVNKLIVAPTMLLPQNVQKTQNAYYALNAALWEAEWNGITTLVVPGMCTGYGKMDPITAVTQMKKAHEHYKKVIRHDKSTAEILDEQPNYYENLEFKKFPVSEVVYA